TARPPATSRRPRARSEVACRGRLGARRRGRATTRGGLQTCPHDVVGNLVVVVVELADGDESLRGFQAHDLVGVVPRLGDGVPWSDRDSQDDPGGALGTGYLTGGAGGRSGGDPVIDNDDGASGEAGAGPAAAVVLGLPVKFRPLPMFHGGEFHGGDTAEPQRAVVDDPHSTLADGPDGQLRLERDAELANHDDI